MAKKALFGYFTDSWQELKKVTWPTKNQAIKLTGIVLGFCFVSAVVLGLVDGIFSYVYKLLLTLA
ncbi:preprotein translocase subunit SecE [Patescibacteria group bacterium]